MRFTPMPDTSVVLRNLRQRIDSLGMNDKIFNVIVPIEKLKLSREARGSGRKIYPGYVLVDMIVDRWFLVCGAQHSAGNRFCRRRVNPVPLKKEEVDYLFKKWTPGQLSTTLIWQSVKQFCYRWPFKNWNQSKFWWIGIAEKCFGFHVRPRDSSEVDFLQVKI